MLFRSGRTEDRHELPFLDRQVDVLQGRLLPKTFGDILNLDDRFMVALHHSFLNLCAKV